MKTPALILSALLLLCFPAGINAQTCQAAFSFGETGLTIEFTDQSASAAGDPITSWFWDFEDGTTSTQQNPVHTFPEADKYDVCLTITTQSGCTNQLCVRIETCVLDVSVNVGSCNANNEIPLAITVNDIYDNAKDVNISVDGQLLPGSPFAIDAATPVTVNTTVPGDGLGHTVTVQSDDIGTCSTTYSFQVPDCSSNCFLSSMSVSVAGGGTQVVQVGDNFFAPQNLTINIGDVVEFQWVGDGHSTTSDVTTGPDSWNSGVIGFGSVYTVNITNPGVHRYYCIPHGGPNGQGMSGMIVANCPSSGQFSLLVSFSTSVADPAGYNILLDGTPVPGGPFSYSGTGPQSSTINIAGDGAAHTIEIQDVADPSCIISRTYTAPNCGAAPACSISASASQAGGCNAADQVLVELTVSAINGGAAGFNVYVDGSLAPGGPFSYNPSGPAVVTVDVPGDGQSHTIEARDIDDPGCSGSAMITTQDCNINCVISNLSVSSGSSVVHTVLVEDFAFNPRDITITSGDIVEWEWIGSVAHTSTSDATAGPDSWDSGLLNQGATYQSPVLSTGVHPYYCIPHGAPGGVGMSGTVTVQANCTNGFVSVAVNFMEQGGGFNGYEILVDGVLAGSFSYEASGSNTASVQVPGDGQSHTITVRDADSPTCLNTTTITTPDCNASTCQLGLSAREAGPCTGSDEVPVELEVTDVGGGASGFEVLLDGASVGTFSYSGSGTTVVTVNAAGDGQAHSIEVRDIDDMGCMASASLTTTNCTVPCVIGNLTASTGSSSIHTVLVEDFAFDPRDITITSGDIVEWEWVGSVAHTSTSDATAGPDSWDSGLLNQGATYQSPVLSTGVHPYYCIPHGAPGGVGMAGTITVQANCTNGLVSVGLSFTASGGGFNGYEVLVDGGLYGNFSYDASGNNSVSIQVPGDGQGHTITVRDADSPTCLNTTTITTPDCNASTCQLGLSAREAGPCTGNDEVAAELTVTDVGGGASGFEVLVDGASVGTFSYSGSGTSVVTVNMAGDGQAHSIEVRDIDDMDCMASASLTTRDCALNCSITNLELTTADAGDPITHVVEVKDFEFVPAQLEVNVGDIVRFEWTGAVAHTTTSDATAGPDSWDSGLLGQGEMFEVTITTEGEHPYYCIPHGAPGGIGMAGMIIATPPCDGGAVSLSVTFDALGGSNGGYNLFIDGELYPGSPFAYASASSNSIIVSLPGDGQQHTVRVQDVVDAGCNQEGSITVPDCGQMAPCSMTLHAVPAGGCDEEDEIAVELTVISEGTGNNGFIVRVDGNLYQPQPYTYSPSGTTNLTIHLVGTGAERVVEVQDVDSTSCLASAIVNTPLCGPACEIQELQVSSGEHGKHIVEVLDFEFLPAQLEVIAGDTVEFIWKGTIAHTSTSDATTGPDSWDSGLLGQGATYQVVITEPGTHPYYCIPHGGPGGIGMAGVIEASEPCDNGTALVTVGFSTTNGSSNGYNIFLDGEYLAGPIPYNNEMGYNSTIVGVPGDSVQHILTVQDLDVSFCAASIAFVAPECEVLCEITGLTAATGPDIAHTVYVEDFQFNPAVIDVRVGERIRFIWAGDIPHTTTSDAITGPDNWNSGLLGQGASYEVVINNPGVHPYYCIPHGGPGGIGMAGVINAAPECENDSVTIAISFDISSGSSMGYNIFVDGQPLPDNPYGYDSSVGNNLQFIRVPGDGATHLITVQDLESGFCAATAQVTVPDCTAGCSITGLAIEFPETRRHLVEVLDFEFVPRELTVTAGDTIEFSWAGAILHTSTSDATSGVDSWDSGLLGQGATFEVIIQQPGQHPYYCIPHGGPGGIGMAGLITALPACHGDSVLASISFDAAGTGSGFSLFLDGKEAGQYSYDPGGTNNLELPFFGDGLTHELIVQDLEEAGCGDTLSIEIPQCAEACLLQATIIQAGACDDNMEVPFELTISGHNPESEGFQLFVDGFPHPGGPVSYNPDGPTVVPFRLTGNGLVHEIRVEDLSNPACYQSFSLDLPNCLEPCAGFNPAFSVEIGGEDSLMVQFTDQTEGTVHQWLWGFGDGFTSNAQNPFHTYAQPGAYTVCLLAQDTILGCDQAACQVLQIGVTAVGEAGREASPLMIFPNPAGQQTSRWMVEGVAPSDYSRKIQYVIYGLRGDRITEGWARGGKVMEIPVELPMPPGLYILELRPPSGRYFGKVAVQ